MEFKRCVSDARFLILSLLIVVIVLYSFGHNLADIKSGNKDMIVMDPDVNVSEDEFAVKVDRIIERCDELKAQTNSKSDIKRYEKTKKDFESLKGVRTDYVKNESVTNVTETLMPTIVVIFVGLLLIVSFLEERKKGLWFFVNSTKRGRESLYIRRCMILGCVGLLTTVIIYVALFLVNWHYVGRPDLTASIQSVDCYEQLILSVNIGQFIGLFILFRALCNVVIIYGIYLLCVIMNDFALGVIYNAIIYAFEYGIFHEIMPNGKFIALKEYNIWNIFDGSYILNRYKLSIILGSAVSLRVVLLVGVVLLLVLQLACGYVYSASIKPVVKSAKEYKIIGRLASAGLGGFEELRKMLIYSLGILFVAGAFFWSKNEVSLVETPYSEIMTRVRVWFGECEKKDFAGVEEYIEGLDKKLGEIDTDDPAYESMSNDIGQLKSRLSYARSFDGRDDVKVLDDTNYQMFFGDGMVRERFKKTLLVIAIIIIIMSNVYAYENRSAMMPIIRSTKFGEKLPLIGKCASVFLVTNMIYWSVFGYDMYEQSRNIGFEHWNLNVNNVINLRNIKFDISIGGFIVLSLMFRLIIVVLIAYLVAFSSRFMTFEKCVVSWAVVLLLPGVIYLTGIDFMINFSVLKLTELFKIIGGFTWLL